MGGYAGPMRANLFHAGNTCPFCQEAIAEGQMIVSCNACGSLHHDTCWQHRGGCSSYHCDERVRADGGRLQAEMVITATETARVTVPPKPVRLGGAEVARPYLPKEPSRLSRLAVLSAVLAVAALAGFWGVLGREMLVLLVGIVVAIAAIVLGVIALVLINTGRKVHGFVPAGVATVVAGALVLVYFASFSAMTTSRGHSHWMNVQIAKSRPTESELARMAPPKARAMRANVVITSASKGVFAGELASGSGIILKVENQTAWILTNRHVITGSAEGGSGADRAITVLFYNGESSEASVEWTAPGQIDLAVLACQALTLEKIEPMEVLTTTAGQGDPVFAVGNPENLYWTYTEGVISGVRTHDQDAEQIELYQTQTPINYGNSGGGLYAQQGQLLGVNTWTRDKAVSEGLNFAISSRSILRLLGEANVARFLASPAGTPAAPPARPAAEGKEPGR